MPTELQVKGSEAIMCLASRKKFSVAELEWVVGRVLVDGDQRERGKLL